jgi:hypothetical protein
LAPSEKYEVFVQVLTQQATQREATQRWQVDRSMGDRDLPQGLADVKPGPDVAAHALLDWERQAILKLAEDWGEIDLSHPKLAHRGSRLDLVHLSQSTVLRVLSDEGLHLPAGPHRQRRQPRPLPDWAELVPQVIWIYEVTHVTAAKRCAVAVLDVVSQYWLATVVCAEEDHPEPERRGPLRRSSGRGSRAGLSQERTIRSPACSSSPVMVSSRPLSVMSRSMSSSDPKRAK